MKKSFPLAVLLSIISVSLLYAQLPETAEDISPLLVGETIPDAMVKDMDGKTVSFHEVVREKPTVLIFYRGGWCPYCNRHLAEIGMNEAAILELGYQVVAISPDKMEKLEETAVKDEISYRLFSDGSGELSKAAGIAFQAPDNYEDRLADWSGGENPGYLPVPSVFVLNTKGEILFEYINPDYKKRMSGALLLAALKVLKEEEE